jgi:hypothetical protein
MSRLKILKSWAWDEISLTHQQARINMARRRNTTVLLFGYHVLYRRYQRQLEHLARRKRIEVRLGKYGLRHGLEINAGLYH